MVFFLSEKKVILETIDRAVVGGEEVLTLYLK